MNQNDVMPPINRFRSQNPQPPNAEAGKLPPMTRPPVVPQKPGISPGVQALMRFQRHATNNAQMPPGGGMAPGVQPVRPTQQSMAQRQAAMVSGIANRPGVSPQVAALMRSHPSQQGQANDLPPMNRMRALR